MSAAGLSRVKAVAIGASAGAVEALSVLLPALPARFPAAVLVVVHLPREGPSLLVDIFSPRTALPVREAQDKELIAPGTVYFAPPDYHLLVDRSAVDGGPSGQPGPWGQPGAWIPELALSVDDMVHFSRPSIDVLFESAADVYGEELMGVVLTGASSDGAAGLETIRRAGGVTVVQDPGSAQAPTMPSAALDRGPADHVLSLQGIAALLRSLGKGVPR